MNKILKNLLFSFIIMLSSYSFAEVLPEEVVKEIETLIPYGSKRNSVVKITKNKEYHINLSQPMNIPLDNPRLVSALSFYKNKIDAIINNMIKSRQENGIVLARSFLGSPIQTISTTEIKMLLKYNFYPIMITVEYSSKKKSVKMLYGMVYQAIIVKKEKIS